MPSRLARLILMTPDGEVVGYLPPIPVDIPWRQEVESVVRAAHKHYGVELTILRLLEVSPERLDGVEVTYLAEIAEPVPAEVWAGRIEAHPLRQARRTRCRPRLGGTSARWAWPGSHRQTCAGSHLESLQRLAHTHR